MSEKVEFINAGHGNLVAVDKVIAVVGVGTAPVKRYIDSAEEAGKLVNISQGRKWRSALIMETNHVILCSISPDTFNNRLMAAKKGIDDKNVMDEEDEDDKE